MFCSALPSWLVHLPLGIGKILSICLLARAYLKHHSEGQERWKCKTLYDLLTCPTAIETGVVKRARNCWKATTIDNERQVIRTKKCNSTEDNEMLGFVPMGFHVQENFWIFAKKETKNQTLNKTDDCIVQNLSPMNCPHELLYLKLGGNFPSSSLYFSHNSS